MEVHDSLLTTRYWLLATRYRKKGRSDSFCHPDPEGIKPDQANSRIVLPKPGWLRYRNSLEVSGTVKNVTVSQSCGKWFVSIARVRKIHVRIVNVWRDFLYKVSTATSQNHAVAAIEDLKEGVPVGDRYGRCSGEECPYQVRAE